MSWTLKKFHKILKKKKGLCPSIQNMFESNNFSQLGTKLSGKNGKSETTWKKAQADNTLDLILNIENKNFSTSKF